MPNLTESELRMLKKQMKREQLLFKEYSKQSLSCPDPQFKIKLEQTAAAHQNHYQILYGFIK
ncbi:MAG: spore coat protein [Oscillospiraceae bacterium]